MGTSRRKLQRPCPSRRSLLYVESVSLKVPVPVADAIRGEASRRLTRPGEVLTDFVQRYWPAYVADELKRDLCPVIDAVVVDDLPEAQRLGEPPSRASEPCLNADDKLSLPPADELDGSGGATP